MNTGKDLKIWRKNNHITQAAFAKKAGYSVSSIAHIESENKTLPIKIKDAVFRVHNELHPKDDSVIEAWRNIRSYGYIPVKEEVDSLAVTLPDLLSTKEIGNIDSTEAYMKFLTQSVQDLLKIKNGSPYKDKESFKNEIMPIVNDIYKAASEYLKAKTSSRPDV